MSTAGFRNLRSFLTELERAGDVVEVEAEVDPHLELAEIHRRVIAAGGPALVFRNVARSAFPVVTNLFGSLSRAELAFGRGSFELVRRAVGLLREELPPSLGTLWRSRDLASRLLRAGARSVRRGPVTEVDEDHPDLRQLPALTSWPDDGGPFITLPLVYTEHPDGHGANLGMYRLQIHDAGSTGMHWQIGKGGGFHFRVAEERGADLPVTVFLGGPPALMLAAIAPLPENVPELVLASVLAGHRLARCPGPGAHRLVAEAEMALVGRVAAGERRPEGPFGDHYGYYSLCHDYPVFRVEHLARRHDALFPATVVGKPRQEDFFIGDLLQELLSPLFPVVMPNVVALWSYGETGYHSLAAAVVRERHRREAVSAALRILGEGQLALTKFLLVTDRPVDLHDGRAVLQHLLERTRPETDLYVLSNVSMDTLDYTGPEVNLGSKGIWLGLGDPVRTLPRQFSAAELPSGTGQVEVFCAGCVVVDAPTWAEDRDAAARIASHPSFRDWPLVVVSDEPGRAVASTVNFLWTTFTRFEPAADLHAAATRVARHHLSYTPPVVIDARVKPWYPGEVHCDPDTAARVTRRWSEYFPGGGVEMGDSERGHLS